MSLISFNKLNFDNHFIVVIFIHKEAWLTQLTQLVVIDGNASCSALVMSEVPQFIFLSPLMFLILINDIADNISPPLRLFAMQ